MYVYIQQVSLHVLVHVHTYAHVLVHVHTYVHAGLEIADCCLPFS